MRTPRSLGWMLAIGTLCPMAAGAADVSAEPPTDVSVTVYRAPNREGGSIDLDDLEGFALISEQRAVHIPAGESRLRFAGVADGIETASVIVAGMPSVVFEKNLDGQLLSSSALIDAAVGKRVVMVRTHAKSGVTEQIPGTIESSENGVVFRSAQGVEALRCSGLSETFEFDTTAGLTSTPTLSVRVRSDRAVNALVTLSYLARGFDWAADYSATLDPDGKTMTLGAWVTLANGNGIGFPAARTQVVAGKLNREAGTIEPIDAGSPIVASCWPQGTTSDQPAPIRLLRQFAPVMAQVMAAPAADMGLQEVAVTAMRKVMQEQLGDLKLYRVPDRTTVASRQSKQVRLLDRSAIPVQTIYGSDLGENDSDEWLPAHMLLRTKNDRAHGLGLPLPSGRVAVFAANGSTPLLENEAELRDLAVDEDVEIDMGSRADVQVQATTESRSIDAARAKVVPLLPGVLSVRSVPVQEVRRVEVSNALPRPIQFELRLQLYDTEEIFRADHPVRTKNGRPLFEFTVPANGRVTVRYQTRGNDQ
jgi:hypothetical protein